MILKAKYVGPFAEVSVPGFAGKVAHPGEEVVLRVRDGFPLGGCWEITEGEDQYRAALEKAQAEKKEKADKRKKTAERQAEKAAALRPDPLKQYLASGEVDATKPAVTEEPVKKNRGGK